MLLLAALMLLAGLSEGVGILLLVPLIGILGDVAGSDNAMVLGVEQALRASGLPLTPAGLLGAFLLLVLLRAILVLARDVYALRIQLLMVDRLRGGAFSALLGAEWQMIRGNRSSDFANLLLTDIGRVGMGVQVLMTLGANLAVMGAYALVALGL